MPCCCKNYVEASFVLGIVLAVVSLLNCYKDPIHGIVGALISGILIFGAKMRNPTAILVWMVFAIIEVVWLIVVAVMATIAAIDPDRISSAISSHLRESNLRDQINTHIGSVMTILVIFIVPIIIFEIWTIFVAKKAREEIQAPGGGQIA